MAGDDSSGGSLISRLASRAERAELSRVAVPGGGVALTGELASRALKSIGARAMTLDRSIIVAEDFNPSNPEDAALFAHEQHHALHGDGAGGGAHDNFRDAEEIAARAAESMVFHRAASGGYEGGYSEGGGPGGTSGQGPRDHSGQGASAGVPSSSEKNETTDSDPDPERGYKYLKAKGWSHDDIVDELARKAMAAMDNRKQSGLDRHVDKRGSFSGSGGM